MLRRFLKPLIDLMYWYARLEAMKAANFYYNTKYEVNSYGEGDFMRIAEKINQIATGGNQN